MYLRGSTLGYDLHRRQGRGQTITTGAEQMTEPIEERLAKLETANRRMKIGGAVALVVLGVVALTAMVQEPQLPNIKANRIEARELAIMCPPSSPIIDAIFPSRKIRSTSSAVWANSSSGSCSTNW